jgi:putative ABC transport system permease protein
VTGWRTATRVARRSVRRHLGRSLLIIALIALPVAAATVGDGLIHSVTDRDTEVDRTMGTADALVSINDRRPYDIGRLLPPGARAVPVGPSNYTGSLRLVVGDRIVRSRPDFVVLGDPMTAHLARLTSGRLPGNPNEVLVTTPLAERLDLLDGDGGLRPNATIEPIGATVAGAGFSRLLAELLGRAAHPAAAPIAVTGLAVKPYCLRCTDVVAMPNSVLTDVMLDGSALPVAYLVDLPDGFDPTELAGARSGAEATILTRDSYDDTTPVSGYLLAATGEPFTLFAGLALIAIVVTVGAAFAVGARQQVRELGLVTVNGGTARHVRQVVLAQGLVLGVVGAATGLLVGAAATVLGIPRWQRMTDQLIEHPRFGWGELVAAAAVGVLASVVAATVPAFNAARTHPVDALTGRVRVGAPRTRWSLLGGLLVLAGMVAVAAAGVVAQRRVAEHRQLLDLGNYGLPVDRTLPIMGTLAGTAVTVVGLVLLMPAVVGAVGRLGALLPLSGRLAVRDAARHRHRTVAASAAVMVAIAGSIVAAFLFATRMDTEPRTLPRDTALASLDVVATYVRAAHGGQDLEDAVTELPRAVPGATTQEITLVTASQDGPGSGSIFLNPRMSPLSCLTSGTQLGIGSPELIELVTGNKPDAGTRSALAEGRVVLFDDCLDSRNGAATMSTNLDGPVTLPVYRARVPAGIEHYDASLPRAFISAEAAAALGWTSFADTMAVTYPPGSLDAVRAAVEDAGMDIRVGEAADVSGTGLYLGLAVLTGVVALLGAGVTVALAAADGRADLATLAALGAPARRRRTLAGAQALVVTGLGTLAGLVVGVCVGFAAVPLAGLHGLSVPWQQLWVALVGAPLVASVVATVATPSRLGS